MREQINSLNDKEYWNSRFSSSGWSKSGRTQTEEYAKANVKAMKIDVDFEGTILDFGCALGDAIPIYAISFPRAQLRGMDISQVAIDQCNDKFGNIADFSCGNHENIQFSDIIIASHIMEHIQDDREIVEKLLGKCKHLFVIVPYKESPLYIEHVNFYDEYYYSNFTPLTTSVFTVSYRRHFDLKNFLKRLLKLKFDQNRDVSKEMVVFHMKGNC